MSVVTTPSLIPSFSGGVVCPIDRSASAPAISFGGDAINNSGTGIYGNHTSVSVSVSGNQIASMTANGLSVLGLVYLFAGAAAPVDGTTGSGFAAKGSLYVDTSAGKLYINTGTSGATTWVVVGTQT